MARIGLINLILGFSIVFIAACTGPFIALDLTDGYLKDEQILRSWFQTVASSAHGHLSLFGILHILFGLTLPYSKFRSRGSGFQTVGLFAGSVAMGPTLWARAWLGPTNSLDVLEVLIGAFLSIALVAVGSHVLGLVLSLRN